MHIIVKSQPSHSMFRPHFNHSLGKFYHTKEDYLGDLKKNHLEPFREIKREPLKDYKMSKEGREMVKQAASYERRKEKPGSRFMKAYKELGVTKKPKWLTDAESMVGGFKEGDV